MISLAARNVAFGALKRASLRVAPVGARFSHSLEVRSFVLCLRLWLAHLPNSLIYLLQGKEKAAEKQFFNEEDEKLMRVSCPSVFTRLLWRRRTVV
jgi:hypothetical protein